MKLVKLALRLVVLLALTCCSLLSWGQYSIISGEYRGEGESYGTLSLLVARPSGKNWTVKGTLKLGSKVLPVSGTLYAATKKVALRVGGADGDAVMNGHFDPATGAIEVDFKLKDSKGELKLQSFSCYNKKQNQDAEIQAFVRDKVAGKTNPDLAVDDLKGTATLRFRDYKGDYVNRTIKFTPLPPAFAFGGKWTFFLDASAISKDEHVNFKVSIWFLDNAAKSGVIEFDLTKGERSFSKVITWNIDVDNGANGISFALNYEGPYVLYKLKKLKKTVFNQMTAASNQTPGTAGKPTNTTGAGGATGKPGAATSTPKAPTLRVVSMRGDVQVRKNSTLQWVDFKDALPLKVGDQISTSFDEEIELALPDGATLRMEPNSTIKVGPLLEATGRRTQAIMDMVHGRVFVRNSKDPGSVRSDIVLRRNEAVWSTRGTAYSLAFDQKEKMAQVHVSEGEVIITIKGEAPVILKAGETWVRKFTN